MVSLQDAAVTYLNTGKSSKYMYLISDCSHTSTLKKDQCFLHNDKNKSVLVTTININSESIIYFKYQNFITQDKKNITNSHKSK